jgi:ppGpp synthetase/RelA/SpoT-type nucleotidyltranferase
MTCPCKKTQEIGTSNNVDNDFLPILSLDIPEKIDLNYNNTNSTKFPNDELEDLNGAGEPFPHDGAYSYGKEPIHEPYLAEMVPCDTYCPVQEIWIQESAEFESKHPRDEDGKFGDKAGDSSEDESGEKQLSQTKEWRRKQEYFGQKRAEYAAYDELGDDITNKDYIHTSPEPNGYHKATAYRVLELFPEMDENTMIKNAWLIDNEREKHEKYMAELAPKLKQSMGGLEGAVVYNRVKGRFKALEKMGRKAKYTEPSQMGDLSGYMVVVPTLADVNTARNRASAEINTAPEKTEDYNVAPKDGYRAIHEEIILPDGTRGELQFKTKNQKVWADYCHDYTYKPDKNTEVGRTILDNKATFQEYTQSYSDYYYQVDLGNTAAIPPPCPDIVRSSIGCL